MNSVPCGNAMTNRVTTVDWSRWGERLRRLVGFGAVGTVGFVVDAAVLTAVSSGLGVNVYVARCVSFSTAVLVTWLLNRAYVFAGSSRPRNRKLGEYGRYFGIQVLGAMINLVVFVALLAEYPGLEAIPIVPLAAGSLLALFFNFAGAQWWVFTQVTQRRP